MMTGTAALRSVPARRGRETVTRTRTVLKVSSVPGAKLGTQETAVQVTHWLSQCQVMAVPLRVNLEEWVSIEENYKSIKMEDQCGKWRVVIITYISTV